MGWQLIRILIGLIILLFITCGVMAGDAPPSIASHWDVLWNFMLALLVIIAALIGLVNALAWRTIARLETKIDGLKLNCAARLPACIELFVKDKVFDKWCEGREALWKAVKHHSHTPQGKVVLEDNA